MYALAINGSPRTGGNTEHILKEVLSPLEEAEWETEIVKIGGTPFRGCTACSQCFKNTDKKCAVTTDAFNSIFEKVMRADALILGTPTYYTDVSAEMKAFIDRTGYVALANGKLLSGKIGAAVTAVRRGGSIHAFDTMNHLFLMSRMIVPGSSYWNMGFGLRRGDVTEDTEGMANMRDLGKTISWLGKIMDAENGSYPDYAG